MERKRAIRAKILQKILAELIANGAIPPECTISPTDLTVRIPPGVKGKEAERIHLFDLLMRL